MAIPQQVPKAVGQHRPAAPGAGLQGRYTDDGDGLHLTLTGWAASTRGTLVLHGRTAGGGYLKAAHAFFADKDGDFFLAKDIASDACSFYLPHGALLGVGGPKFTVSARIVQPAPGGSHTLASEDLMLLDAVERPFSIVRYLRPLLVMAKAVAEADGALAIEEVRYIRELVTAQFSPSAAELEQLRVFLKTTHARDAHEAAATLRYRLPTPDPATVAAVLKELSAADREVNAQEAQLMQELLQRFGMADAELAAFIDSLGLADQKQIDAHLALLGLSGRPTREELQRARRRAMKDFHPDKYHASDLPDAVKAMIARQGAEINAAYEALQRAFGYTD